MGRPRISAAMARAILEALRAGRFLADGRTATALRSRGLLRSDGSLTDGGFALAVELAPLEEQCEKLGLPLRSVAVPLRQSPVACALRVAQAFGWRGTTCEGRSALILLKAGILDFLQEHSPSGADDALTRMVEAQVASYQQTHAGESGADVAPRNALYRPLNYPRWEEALSQVLAKKSVQAECPELDATLGMELVHAVGHDRWFRIAEALCRDPYGFRNGWPDLLIVNDHRDLLGIEVKVGDRLHSSQIRTLPILRDEIGVPIEVWKLVAAA